MCARPAPTASTYSACALDADCPRGDHCSLGACTHDCLADAQCSQGQVCTDRGRCTTPAQVGAEVAAPPPSPPALSVQPALLDFGQSLSELTITLANTGMQPLSFRALSDKPWVAVEPSSGVVTGGPVTLTVRLSRGDTGGDTHARVRINSTAGAADVEIAVARDLSGFYSGIVEITSPYSIASSALHLSLFQNPDGIHLNGFVDPDRSLLFPFRSGVSGTVTGDQVALTFVISGAQGSLANPRLPRPVRRTITLTGQLTGVGTLEGTVADVVTGPIDGHDISLGGTFRLQRAGPPVDGQADSPPDLVWTPVTSPLGGAAYDTCRNYCLPGVVDCNSPVQRADAFLQSGVILYSTYSTALGKSGDPYDNTITSCGASCLNESYITCAQYWYYQAAFPPSGGPGDPAGRGGLLYGLEAFADNALLYGNARMVAAVDMWKTSGTVAGELEPLQDAADEYTAGNHGSDQTRPSTLMDPFWLREVYERITPADLATSNSRVTTLLSDGTNRGPYEYLQRHLAAVGGALRASSEKADRQIRLGDPAAAKSTLWAGAVQGYLDLAILSSLLEKAGAAEGAVSLQPVLTEFRTLSRRFDDVNEGRNPAGFLPSFVPLLLNPAAPGNNYEQTRDFVTNVIKPQAKADEDAAKAIDRTFEQSETAFTTQLSQQVTALESQLLDLCGSTDGTGCGTTSGQLFNAVSETKTAMLRVQMAQERIINLHEDIRIERDRARAISGIQVNEAQLILEDGRRLNVLAEDERKIDILATAATGYASFIANAAQGKVAEAVVGLVSMEASMLSSVAKSQIEDERQMIQSEQSARVEFDAATETLINSAALIKTKLLESNTLFLDLAIAREGALQAAANVLSLKKKAELVMAQRAQFIAVSTQSARQMLQFRVERDAASVRAEHSFQQLMMWGYLVTRAFEYEVNASYASLGNLWAARSASEIATYLTDLDSYYKLHLPGMPQPYQEVISVRDQLLDLGEPRTDEVTGKTYEPRERFRRYVADPAHRDVNGNLRIHFSTNRPDKALFSSAVCNDRISSLRANLIGDNLGPISTAYVRLTESGTGYLRSCGSHELVAYDLTGTDRKPKSAHMQAGINAGAPNTAGQPNTDLLAHSVLTGPWELVIDQRPDVEPGNAKLDLNGLSDIELIVDHNAYTIQ